MSWADEVAKPTSTKVSIAEIDIGQAASTWINYTAGVWYFQNTVSFTGDYSFGYGAFGYGSFGSSGTGQIGNRGVISNISSILLNGVALTLAASLAACVSTEDTFYYDAGTTRYYVHLTSSNPPNSFLLITIGETAGFRRGGTTHYYGDIPYEPRILSIPSIARSKDPLTYGVVRFEGGQIIFDNHDGYFDGFKDSDVYGQQVRIKFGFEGLTLSEFRTVYTGYVEDFEADWNEFRLNVIDDRKSLSGKLPPNVFTTGTYANLDPNNANKPIPLVYGTCRHVPCVCTNEAENPAPATFTFKVCDVTNHSSGVSAITTVYVDGAVVVPSATTLTAGTFTLATADYDPGQTVTATITGVKNAAGTVIQNGLAVIRDLLETFASVTWTATNVNTTEWNIAQAAAANVGLALVEETTIVEAIEQICRSVNGSFLVQDDGRYSFRFYNPTAILKTSIPLSDIMEMPRASFENTDYATSALIFYDRNWNTGEFKRVIDASLESSVFTTYKRYRQLEIETLLPTSTAADTLAASVMSIAKAIKPVFTFTTKTQNIDLQIEDLIAVYLERMSGSWFGVCVCNVIGIDKDLTANMVTITARYIRQATDAEINAIVYQATLDTDLTIVSALSAADVIAAGV